MADQYDTLNIGSIRLKKEYPIAEVEPHQSVDAVLQPANHPAAAEAARARIASILDDGPIANYKTIPATPTADLITDKQVLAKHALETKAVSRKSHIPSALRPFLTAVGIFALVLLLFKAPIILSQINFALHPPATAPAVTTAVAPTEVIPADNTLTIAKINVQVPVIYEPSVQEADVQKALQNGVVHYGNTSMPGQGGNVAIFGHSSNDWWEPGNFKFVFVLLDKLAPGDDISMDYQSHRYTYQVTGSQVVEPTDVAVLNPTPTPTLTLITCTPPGTSLKRLVVSAKQISPDPAGAAAIKPSPTASAAPASSLTSSETDLFTQVKKAWDGVTNGIKSLFGGDKSTPNSPASTPTPGTLPAIK